MNLNTHPPRNRHSRGRLASALLASLLLSLAFAMAPVQAGGWATVTTVEPLTDVRIGEATTLVLEVKQHGQTAINWETPTLSAINTTTGERVNATGIATEPVGHYDVNLTFPSAGEWSWAVTLAQLAVLESEFALITVTDADTAPAAIGAEAGATTQMATSEVVANLSRQVASLQTTVASLQSGQGAAVAERDSVRTDLAALRSDANATEQTTRWLIVGLVIVSALLLATIATGVILLQRKRSAAEPPASIATINARWRAT